MNIEYRNNNVRKLCEDEQYALKRLPQNVAQSLGSLMYKLNSCCSFNEFSNNPANKKYKPHPLKGEKKGLIALYIDYQYRMTIKILIKNVNGTDKIKIWEVSNHYGD